MNARVYWFSGTGNSLWAARELAQRLGTEAVPMARYTDGRAPLPGADAACIVFPVYNHLIPYLVQRFVEQTNALVGQTIYALCTCGDSPGISLEYLQIRMESKGGTLAGGFAVQMPYNYVSPSKSLRSVFQPFKLREIPAETQRRMFDAAKEKLASVADYIQSGRHGALETEYAGIEHLADRLHLRDTLQKRFWLRKAGYRGKAKMTSVECVRLMDAGFHATDACVGCQTCVRVCPVHNIAFSEGKPRWLQRCEQCFACLQWCPQAAIQFGEGTQGGKRYHHPAIQLKDLMLNASTNRQEKK